MTKITEINYFMLLDTLPSLKVDAAALKRTFFIKSREWHPDYFSHESELKQSEALAMTSLLNQAYTALTDPLKRLTYFLTMHEIEITGNAQALPQMFLFEMMDLNESIESVSTAAAKEQAEDSIATLESNLIKEVKDLFDSDDLSNIDVDSLDRLKTYYLKSKYLIRLRETLDRVNLDG